MCCVCYRCYAATVAVRAICARPDTGAVRAACAVSAICAVRAACAVRAICAMLHVLSVLHAWVDHNSYYRMFNNILNLFC